MDNTTTISIISALLGAIVAYMVFISTRKIWYLETLNPREQYEIGREKRLIINLKVKNKTFHGVKAGKYTILLVHGTIGEYSKPILQGKLEEMYLAVVADSLIKKKLVTKIEKIKFLDFLFRRLPELKTKAYLITGEPISPREVLDELWGEDAKERAEAFNELRRRRLISSTVLWIKPYPPEGKLTDIMRGVISIPDIVAQHQNSYAELIETYRKTLIQMNSSLANILKDFIPLARHIITAIGDPTFNLAVIVADRAKQVEGIGLERLAERGGMDSYIYAAKTLREKTQELVNILQQPITKKEKEKVEEYKEKAAQIEERIKRMESQLAEIQKAVAKT